MNILLMIPINKSYVIAPSLGLGYLAAVLRKGNSVNILHCIKESFNFNKFRKYLNESNFDLIGMQMMSYDLLPAKTHIDIIRNSKCKNSIIVVGGPHPSGDPKGTLNYLQGADFAFKGEAEIGLNRFAELAKGKNLKEDRLEGISGLVWRKDNGVAINEVEYIDDLDSIPFPAWDIIKPQEYPPAPHGAFFKSLPAAPIIITRGCPFICTFCAGKCITGNKVRKRSANNVMEEIKYLIKDFGIYEFMIEDENFTLHKNLVLEFCEALIKNNLSIGWSCPSGVRLDTLDLEMIKMMEKSGCHSLSVGIEFGSQRMLDFTKKNITLDKIKEKITLIRKTSIKITGFFMMGMPMETEQDMKRTAVFSRELDIDRAQFNNFMPLPGSALYENLLGADALDAEATKHFFVHDVGYVPECLTAKKLKALQRQAYLKFYLRPKTMWNILKEIKDYNHLMKLLYRFYDAII
ncbi:MAG: radical SAM protein [Candidatus Omnitrophota bacterium]